MGERELIHNSTTPTVSEHKDAMRRFRGIQIQNIISYTPFMMFGNVVCAILYIYITYNTNLRLAILLWSAILLGIVIFALKSWWRSRGNVSVERASRRAIKHAKANAFILGAWWGIGAAAIYLEVGSSDRAIVAAIVGGMICGGGFALSSLPSAMIAYLVPLVTGSAFTLFWSGELNDSFLAILLGVFAFIIYKSGTGHGRLLKTNFDDREKLSEQSSIIGLLLREFEEGTSDWLWETDQSGKLVRGGERFLQDLGFDINAADQVDDDLFDADGSMAGYTQNGLSAVQNKIASRRPFRDIAFSITHDHKTGGYRSQANLSLIHLAHLPDFVALPPILPMPRRPRNELPIWLTMMR